jgi:hypothetical protein
VRPHRVPGPLRCPWQLSHDGGAVREPTDRKDPLAPGAHGPGLLLGQRLRSRVHSQ